MSPTFDGILMSKYPTSGLTAVSLEELAWLSGIWHGRHGEQIVEEHWSGVNGRSLMAMFRWLKADNSVWFYELMAIEQEADGRIFLRIKHFYPGLKGWEEKDESAEFLLVQLEDRKAAFHQLNKSDTWMVYHRDAPDRLLAYFEKEGEAVKEDDIFVYHLTL